MSSLPLAGIAQKAEEYKQPRILILLDGSSSMVNPWAGGKDRFKTASEIILRLMDSVYRFNDKVEFSLRVYGHEHNVPENNCTDTRREVAFSKDNLTQMGLRLESLHPRGVSPIAYSLKQAAENDFENERDYAYSLILITDGGESCGGDICAVVKALLDKKIEFRPYIISLVDYAPLKDQYACLGTYLQVSRPSEITPAISTVTGAYKRTFALPVPKPKLLEKADTHVPLASKISAPPVTTPVFGSEPDEALHAIARRRLKPIASPRALPRIATRMPRPVIRFPLPEPVVPDQQSRKIIVDTAAFKRELLTRIKPRKQQMIPESWQWAIGHLYRKAMPPLSLPKAEPAPTPPKGVATKPAVKPPVPAKEEQKEAPFTMKSEPSPETLLEIFFTNGRGKFYPSTPAMQLIDAKSGQQVKRFYRTIDAQGNPDPQTVPSGDFTLVIGSSNNYVSRNVVIKPNSRNQVFITVSNGSLSFRYENNPKRPVTEFQATVKRNFVSGPTVFQECSTQLEYEPGNYHLEINTLPVTPRMVDLEFGINKPITISEPGFVKFLNTNVIDKVLLYYPLGDQFVAFYTMRITGKPDAQKLRLQPGPYQAHLRKDPRLPFDPSNEVIQNFQVKSNDTTNVLLQ